MIKLVFVDYAQRHISLSISAKFEGAQRFSGRVLDSRPRGRGFEPHRHPCVVSLRKTH